MEDVMELFLWSGIILLIASLVILFSKDSTKEQQWIFCTIIFLGIYILSCISNYKTEYIGEQITSLRFALFGASYMIFTCFMFTMSYYQYKLPYGLRIFLFMFHTIICVASFTFDRHKLFYTSYKFEDNLIVTTPGPLYIAHVISLFIYLIIMIIGAVKYKLKYRDKVDTITWFSILSVSIIQCGFFFAHVVIKLLYIYYPVIHNNKSFMFLYRFDTIEAYYVFFAIAIFVTVVRYKTSDLLGIASQMIIENLGEIVLIFDKFGKNIYSNIYAHNAFVIIDPTLDEFQKNIEKFRKDEYYYINGIYYEAKLHNINGGTAYTFTDNSSLISEKLSLIEDISRKNADLSRLQENLIRTFADMVEMRDGTTGSHTKRTAQLVMRTAQKLQELNYRPDVLNNELMQYLEMAAVLHDVGKIGIPDAILNKPGKLTNDEFELIKLHPGRGSYIIEHAIHGVENTQYLMTAHDIALYHHEKWNGAGYPKGLKEEEIPIPARIMALADVYDALVEKRPYKEPFTHEKAAAIIKDSLGTHFDPFIGEIFLDIVEEYHHETIRTAEVNINEDIKTRT